MRLILTLLVSLLISMPASLSAQNKPAYQFFSSKGKKASYSQVLTAVKDADVVFFGELHNDPIAHWLQYELLRDLSSFHSNDAMLLGMEMFETPQQALLDSFLNGQISPKDFLASEGLWSNYTMDYHPMVAFCKENNIPVIAGNAPRSIVRQVGRQGMQILDTLSAEQKAFLPALPIPVDYELPSYVAMREMMGGHGGAATGINNFVSAQALRDATMAWRIVANWAPGKHLLHINGSYHSDLGEGIVWYLRRALPEVKVVILTTVSQDKLDKMESEHGEKADFILVTPSTMTKSY